MQHIFYPKRSLPDAAKIRARKISMCRGSRSGTSVLWHMSLIGLKNDYNGVTRDRGPYLSRGGKGHRTPEICSYP